MKVCKVNLINPQPEIIKLAAETLMGGGLIIYPTDTAYGLGANALDEMAVRKVYLAKGRDFAKPIHVVVRDLLMAQGLGEVNDAALKLFSLLPGALTIIIKKNAPVPSVLSGETKTIGVRIPDCEVTKALSMNVDFPYTTSSANLSGGKTPYTTEEAIGQIGQHVDLVLDAGELPRVPPSTIIDTTCSPPKILRKGPTSKDQLEKVLGQRLELEV